ncbi:MAG: RNA 2',3'-cyclic phosphodiesterase [Patescibacteria group bacterium]
MRVFLAIHLPVAVKESLAQMQACLARDLSGVRWVDPEKMHLTLFFWADFPCEAVSKLKKVVSSVAIEKEPFEVSLGSWGVFPHKENPRVLWVGLQKGKEQMLLFHKSLKKELLCLDIEFADKHFVPHITLGRVKKIQLNKCSSLLDEAISEVTFSVNSVSAVHSVLKPSGSEYRQLFAVSFT